MDKELDYKESWTLKNWCFWTVVLEKTLEGPLDSKETQPVHPKGNKSWLFIGRTDAEAETAMLWPPDAKNWLIGKDPDAGKDWRQEEKGTTEDYMVGWHCQLNGHEFEQALGVGDGQGGLVCWSLGGCKELDMTERLNWTELIQKSNVIFIKIPSVTFITWKPIIKVIWKCKLVETIDQWIPEYPTRVLGKEVLMFIYRQQKWEVRHWSSASVFIS